MRIITDFIDNIEEEIELAKLYAQNYVLYRNANNLEWSNKYKEMTKDSIKHINNICELTKLTINQLQKDYTLPKEILKVWKKKSVRYANVVEWISEMIKGS